MTCKRCDEPLGPDGFCQNDQCPFDSHQQTCDAGWAGHPDHDPHPDDDTYIIPCTCGKKRKKR